MIGVGAVLRTADADDFVFDPDAAARQRTDLRAFAIIGATFAGALAVTAWLWLRWRGRPVALGPAEDAKPAAAPAAGAPLTPSRREPVPADLNAILARLERAMRQRTARRATFRLSLLPELWRCRAESPTVRGLVLDLVAAASAGLQGKGELVVGTRNIAFDAAALGDTPGAQLGEYARITVRDNGPGLSEEALERIFDRAASPRPSAAAAAEAMRGLGGFARVESAEGIGTAVHLYFPRVAELAQGAITEGKPAEAAA